MVLNGLGKGTENNPQLRQLLLERRRHRHAIEHRIDGDAGHEFLFFQGDPEFVEGRLDFGVDLVKAVQPGLLLRRGVIHDGFLSGIGAALAGSMANKSNIVIDLRGWRTPSVSGEELQDLVAFDVGDEAVPDPRFAGSSMV